MVYAGARVWESPEKLKFEVPQVLGVYMQVVLLGAKKMDINYML